VNRKDFQELSKIRLREAQSLLDSGMSDGAYYLAGYAVECALKACIAKKTQRFEFPDWQRVKSSYSHNLADLVELADLEEARREYVKRDVYFEKSWRTVVYWSEQSRYRSNSPEAARALLSAITDRRYGVLTWIKRHW
jgi:HEPN domain-containing protein